MKKILVNHTVEAQVREYVFNSKNNQSIMHELSADLRFVFGDDYEKKFRLPSDHYSSNRMKLPSYAKAEYWAQMLIMSNKGLLCNYEFNFGFSTSGLSYADYEWNKRMLMAIERNIRRFGIDIYLCQKPITRFENGKYEYTYVDKAGVFLPIVSFVDKDGAKRVW